MVPVVAHHPVVKCAEIDRIAVLQRTPALDRLRIRRTLQRLLAAPVDRTHRPTLAVISHRSSVRAEKPRHRPPSISLFQKNRHRRPPIITKDDPSLYSGKHHRDIDQVKATLCKSAWRLNSVR